MNKFTAAALGAGLLALLWPKRASAQGTPGPSTSTEADRVRFVADMLSAINDVAPYLSKDAKVIIVGQAAFESGWGASVVAKAGKNPFNITRVPSDPGPVIVAGDLEYDKAGNAKVISQRFAKYGDFTTAVASYLNLLVSNPRYRGAFAHLEAGNLTQFITVLSAGGYFTLPLAQYLAQMQAMRASVLKRWPGSVVA